MIPFLLLLLFGYLLGSLSTAIILCRINRLPDPRLQGSKNPGATNVLRIGGKKIAFLTLLGDMLKGVIPTVLARLILHDDALIILVGLAAFLGHLYPIFFRFQGGKGVATSLGVLLAANPLTGLSVVLTWLIVAGISRFSSLSAMVALTAAPGYYWLITHQPFPSLILAVMSILILYQHRGNIRNLMTGREPRIGQKK